MEYTPTYLHVLFPGAESKFDIPLIESLQDEKNGLFPERHYFAVYTEACYEALRHFDHVLYYPPKTKYAVYETINAFGDQYDWIFVHGLSHISHIWKIKRRLRKKIIWRTWGHDVLTYHEGQPLKNCLRKAYERLIFSRVVAQFRGIGVASFIDEINLKNHHLFNKSYFCFNYPNRNSVKDNCYTAKPREKRTSDTYRLMIGHAAGMLDNHGFIIRQVAHLKDENIRFVFPIATGDASRVKAEAIRILGEDKCEFMETLIPYAEYCEAIDGVDGLVLDGRASYALGILKIALNYRKTLFLNRNGLLAEALRGKHIPMRYTDEMGCLSFDELCQPVDYPASLPEELQMPTYKDMIARWQLCLTMLNETTTDNF